MDNTAAEIKEIIKNLEESIDIKKAALNSLISKKNEVTQNFCENAVLNFEEQEALEELMAAIDEYRRSLLQMENAVESLKLYTDYSGFYHWV